VDKINPPIKPSINQTSHQSIKQAINQAINQSSRQLMPDHQQGQYKQNSIKVKESRHTLKKIMNNAAKTQHQNTMFFCNTYIIH